VSGHGHRVRVAIADDNESVRVFLRMLVQAEPDFEFVGEAADGAEAVSLAERERPDLLILDIAMPGLDGLQVLERLRSSCPEVQIVVYSGSGATTLNDAVLELGAADCVKKGVSNEELIERLRRAAARRA
jgi:DNA-binding NarL/FixJ family response regulator